MLKKVLLFDIDGTLVLSGGAGLRAMSRAFERVYGVADALKNLNLAGRTDSSIIEDALRASDLQADGLDEFKSVYFELIEEEIRRPLPGKRVMSGVETLIPELAGRPHLALGLLTGNWEMSGRIKLAHFGLSGYFPFGAFADDSGQRDRLLPFALRRAERLSGERIRPQQAIIIGDTPADILCGKPHGAVTVGIGAAHYSIDQLREYEPDALFESLEPTAELLDLLG